LKQFFRLFFSRAIYFSNACLAIPCLAQSLAVLPSPAYSLPIPAKYCSVLTNLDQSCQVLSSLFVCIAAAKLYLTNERTLSAVPSRILINSSRCDTTPVDNSYNQHFSLEGDITLGGHPSHHCPDVASLLYSNRENRCFNITHVI
jgi:hypothetical protein